MTPIDNVTLITMSALDSCRPAREEWTSFGELYGKWAANAKKNSHQVFWIIDSERKAQNAVCLAAIAHIMETHGRAVGSWLVRYFKEMQHPTLDGLRDLAEGCPDESILPLAPQEPVRDLLGMERFKTAMQHVELEGAGG